MPFWTLDEQGKAGRIARRSCTVDSKVLMIQSLSDMNFWATGLSRLRPEDISTHELPLAFPVKRLIVPSPADTLCFKTDFPLSRWVGEQKRTATPIIWMSGAWTARPAPA